MAREDDLKIHYIVNWSFLCVNVKSNAFEHTRGERSRRGLCAPLHYSSWSAGSFDQFLPRPVSCVLRYHPALLLYITAYVASSRSGTRGSGPWGNPSVGTGRASCSQ